MTWVGASVIVGISSATYAKGIGLGLLGLMTVIFGFSGVAIFAERIQKFGAEHGAISLPEFLGHYYGRTVQRLSAVIISLSYIALLAAQYLALSLMLKAWGGIAFEWAVVCTGLLVISYTSISGLRGDILSDTVHTLVILVGLGFVFPSVISSEVSMASILEVIPETHFDPSHFAGWGFLVGGALMGGLMPMVSMDIWQRVYSASPRLNLKKAMLVSAVLVVLLYLLTIYFGFAALQIVPDLDNPDEALYRLMVDLLPAGLLGLVIAALLSVILTTANSMSLVVSACLHRDLLPRYRLNKHLITLGVSLPAILLAVGFPNVAGLMLNAFFILVLLFVPTLFALLNRPLQPRAVSLSILFGVLTVMVALPYYPNESFIFGMLVSLLTIIVIQVLYRKEVYA